METQDHQTDEVDPQQSEDWHALGTDETIAQFDTPPDSGLSSQEAAKRIERYGPNQLAEAPPTTIWQMLWEQFNNFVVILLIIAAVISALLGDYVESGAIIAIVVLNAVLGIVQERRAEQALAALQELAAPDANIIRAGHRITVPASQLVPGDIVFLESGNYVPADVRLIDAVNARYSRIDRPCRISILRKLEKVRMVRRRFFSLE